MKNKNSIYAQQINSIKISLSSPEDVLAKSSGEVTKPGAATNPSHFFRERWARRVNRE